MISEKEKILKLRFHFFVAYCLEHPNVVEHRFIFPLNGLHTEKETNALKLHAIDEIPVHGAEISCIDGRCKMSLQ